MLQPRPGVAALSEKAKFSVGLGEWLALWREPPSNLNLVAGCFAHGGTKHLRLQPDPKFKVVWPNWNHFWFSKTDLTWRWWQHFCQNHRRHDSLLQSLWNRGPRSRMCSSCRWPNACDSLFTYCQDTLAFLDAFPKTKGHSVLIPKRKARTQV